MAFRLSTRRGRFLLLVWKWDGGGMWIMQYAATAKDILG